MKCKICKTERDDLTGDICVDCLADKLSELFTRQPTRHTVEDLTAEVAGLKADMVRLKSDVARLKMRARL